MGVARLPAKVFYSPCPGIIHVQSAGKNTYPYIRSEEHTSELPSITTLSLHDALPILAKELPASSKRFNPLSVPTHITPSLSSYIQNTLLLLSEWALPGCRLKYFTAPVRGSYTFSPPAKIPIHILDRKSTRLNYRLSPLFPYTTLFRSWQKNYRLHQNDLTHYPYPPTSRLHCLHIYKTRYCY